jgi:hypothetical protein
LTDIMQRADVRMVQRGDAAGLALEALAQRWVTADMGRQDFDGHRAIEPCISRAIDLAHAARAERRQNFVGPEAGTGTGGMNSS